MKENRAYAESISDTLGYFRQNNAEVLADDATLPLISQGLAKIAPEIVDNLKNNLMFPEEIIKNMFHRMGNARLFLMRTAI